MTRTQRTQLGISAVILTVMGVIVGLAIFGGGHKTQAQLAPVVATVGSTDLKVGVTYEVLRTRLERLPNGWVVRAWYFTGKDRSLRSQYTPKLDGRGRRIMRVVTNDGSLPIGHMRLVRVSEVDPSLEGFTFGDHNWTGIQIQINPRHGLVSQRTIPNGGPARK